MSFIDRSQDLAENRELSRFLKRSIPTYNKQFLLSAQIATNKQQKIELFYFIRRNFHNQM